MIYLEFTEEEQHSLYYEVFHHSYPRATCYFDDRFIDVHGNKHFLYYYDDEVITQLPETFLKKEQLAKQKRYIYCE